MQDIDKDIETILNEFNFKKVRKAMKALDWVWYQNNKVPSTDELKEEADRLLRAACRMCTPANPQYFVSSGGLRAECSIFPGDTKRYLVLLFAVDETTNNF